jgi:hypothetical protein
VNGRSVCRKNEAAGFKVETGSFLFAFQFAFQSGRAIPENKLRPAVEM